MQPKLNFINLANKGVWLNPVYINFFIDNLRQICYNRRLLTALKVINPDLCHRSDFVTLTRAVGTFRRGLFFGGASRFARGMLSLNLPFFKETEIGRNKHNSIEQKNTDFVTSVSETCKNYEKFEFVANLC